MQGQCVQDTEHAECVRGLGKGTVPASHKSLNDVPLHELSHLDCTQDVEELIDFVWPRSFTDDHEHAEEAIKQEAARLSQVRLQAAAAIKKGKGTIGGGKGTGAPPAATEEEDPSL